MVALAELGLLIVVVLAVLIGYRALKAIRPFVMNAIVGLVVFFIAGLVGFGVQLSPVVVLLVAFGGLPAAILVIVLAHTGLLFEPATLGPLLAS